MRFDTCSLAFVAFFTACTFILKIIGGICVYERERKRALQPPL